MITLKTVERALRPRSIVYISDRALNQRRTVCYKDLLQNTYLFCASLQIVVLSFLHLEPIFYCPRGNVLWGLQAFSLRLVQATANLIIPLVFSELWFKLLSNFHIEGAVEASVTSKVAKFDEHRRGKRKQISAMS